PVDFNEDNLGDFVYSSTDANQLIVIMGGAFGNVVGGFSSGLARISLDAPILPESVVVADFNHDGHQDIAAASQDQGAFGGISVFLSKYEDTNRDGVLSATEDLNGNGINDFLVFEGGFHRTLPA